MAEITREERARLRERLGYDTEPFLLTKVELTGLLNALDAAEAEELAQAATWVSAKESMTGNDRDRWRFVADLLDDLDAAEAEELEARAELLTAIARAEAAEAREAKLREVLQVIAAPCGTEGPLWATMHARSALAQGGA